MSTNNSARSTNLKKVFIVDEINGMANELANTNKLLDFFLDFVDLIQYGDFEDKTSTDYIELMTMQDQLRCATDVALNIIEKNKNV